MACTIASSWRMRRNISPRKPAPCLRNRCPDPRRNGLCPEYHVERYFREIQIARIAPVSSQLILSHIAERVLGLPKSY